MWGEFRQWALKLNLWKALLVTGVVMMMWGTLLNVIFTIVQYRYQRAWMQEQRVGSLPDLPGGIWRGTGEEQEKENDSMFVCFPTAEASFGGGVQAGVCQRRGAWSGYAAYDGGVGRREEQTPPRLSLLAFFLSSPLMISLGVVSLLLCLWYWLLIMIWTFQKCVELGIRSFPWVFMTFFFNLILLLVLYLYAAAVERCKGCGHVRIRDATFCPRCGAAFRQKCPSCGGYTQLEDQFCPWCGIRLLEEGEKRDESG